MQIDNTRTPQSSVLILNYDSLSIMHLILPGAMTQFAVRTSLRLETDQGGDVRQKMFVLRGWREAAEKVQFVTLGQLAATSPH